MAFLIDKHGRFLKRHRISEGAYRYVVNQLAEFIAQHEATPLYALWIEEHVRFVKKLKWWPFDYLKPLDECGLLEKVSSLR